MSGPITTRRRAFFCSLLAALRTPRGRLAARTLPRRRTIGTWLYPYLLRTQVADYFTNTRRASPYTRPEVIILAIGRLALLAVVSPRPACSLSLLPLVRTSGDTRI